MSGNLTLSGGPALRRRIHAVGAVSGKKAGQRWALLTTRYAKLSVARKTGMTGRSIHPGPISETSAQVRAGGAAGFLEHGTSPHEIRPRRRKALRWAASASGRRLSGRPRRGAAVVFAKRVHHPGTKAQPFLVPAARRALREIGVEGTIVEAWNGAA